MTPAQRLRNLANQFGRLGDDPLEAASFIRADLASDNFFKVDAAAANAVLEEWERSPEADAARAVEAAVLAEVNAAEPTWERISGGLDLESLIDLARIAARQLCFPQDPETNEEAPVSLGLCGMECPCAQTDRLRCPVTLDHLRGMALIGSDPENPKLILRWDGDEFARHVEGTKPLKALEPITPDEFRILKRQNTPEATWARIANGRTEGELTDLASQAFGRFWPGVYTGYTTLDHTTGSAEATVGRKVFTLKWSEELEEFEYSYLDRELLPSVLVKVEHLRQPPA